MSKRIKMLATTLLLIVMMVIIYLNLNSRVDYKIENQINIYDLKNEKNREDYLNYVKKLVKPKEIEKFVKNEYIDIELLDNQATGYDVVEIMKIEGYEELFNSLFDRSRLNYDDCPVTTSFKNKYGNNLAEYYNLVIDDNDEVYVKININRKELVVDVLSDFLLGTPQKTSRNYYYYVLDDDGNVDDVIFDYTE